ncbi:MULTISPECIES: peptide-methionine (S)-S-oxide reductase MsrA [Ensifer]|jgi:peptide-methionine (S)-S-oxide reductase|uniref:Peptide methionine sulfoxide reductase MsrA n=1 Tax=Ensifer canadensis TaxID=555315 RepID=A0AAW4FCH6_9HYPH|nr:MULTISPECIES: peptide-methionine (S)-S-oxide reductase MsrA [Ensifer]MDP9628911.1 peptide-methionine (S)-S-oxide reductase [Ensifer adhaerens]KQU98507.1 peptide methionine sulfoxide reductase [Ensifer sp. Root31]KQW63267.1 peptide methionine sulfoxide reductase [Ensifer sp. Root1252]KQW85281.1 peptide methionine sulfoxide reductase [Ensifer sp. Root127]KQY75673.1 peptide methionine sulfoxide reductase [Ensifer sp. Root142]
MFLIDMFNKKTIMPDAQTALRGREDAIPTAATHFVSGHPLKGPYPEGMEKILLGMGCFWGAERLLWNKPGVYVTAAGYSGGMTPNPTYQETTTGLTGHTEVVLVVYDPEVVPLSSLLKTFFEEHDPTQGMRQGNDIGTTYRSAIYVYDDAQLKEAKAARDAFQAALKRSGHTGKITTEIAKAGPLYFAEDYHQQYLAKNPVGYCALRGTGVSCPIGA